MNQNEMSSVKKLHFLFIVHFINRQFCMFVTDGSLTLAEDKDMEGMEQEEDICKRINQLESQKIEEQ